MLIMGPSEGSNIFGKLKLHFIKFSSLKCLYAIKARTRRQAHRVRTLSARYSEMFAAHCGFRKTAESSFSRTLKEAIAWVVLTRKKFFRRRSPFGFLHQLRIVFVDLERLQ